ncbi:hypothetical protein, partial [Kitasatospora sp. NPDC093558]|uniref:hypothetical protein n=1 Tax=Kitasatospora sp. NPDC093558 TaxID=3155201 RepID=UPI00342344BD
MVLRAGGPHDPAVWLADGTTTFLGSGFFVAPGLVVTCAHVVHAVHAGQGRRPITVHGVLGAEEVLSAELWPPDRPA